MQSVMPTNSTGHPRTWIDFKLNNKDLPIGSFDETKVATGSVLEGEILPVTIATFLSKRMRFMLCAWVGVSVCASVCASE